MKYVRPGQPVTKVAKHFVLKPSVDAAKLKPPKLGVMDHWGNYDLSNVLKVEQIGKNAQFRRMTKTAVVIGTENVLHDIPSKNQIFTLGLCFARKPWEGSDMDAYNILTRRRSDDSPMYKTFDGRKRSQMGKIVTLPRNVFGKMFALPQSPSHPVHLGRKDPESDSLSVLQMFATISIDFKLGNEMGSEILIPRRILILDEVQDPGNVGLILRSALAFNWAEEIWILTGTADPFNVKVLRASQAAGLYSNIVYGTWEECRRRLQTLRASVIVADAQQPVGWSCHVQARTGFLSYTRPGETPATIESDKPLALILSHEGRGPKVDLEDLERIFVPMGPVGVGSLNVSTAAGILMYGLKIDTASPVSHGS